VDESSVGNVLEVLRQSLAREEQEMMQLEVEVMALESKKVSLSEKRSLVNKYRELIKRYESGEPFVSMNGTAGPTWISPGEFKGMFPNVAVSEYLKKRAQHEGMGRVNIRKELLPRLLAGGAHVKGKSSQPVTHGTIKAAIAQGVNEGKFRYDKNWSDGDGWVQLIEWPE
jgi:hypothetical protein